MQGFGATFFETPVGMCGLAWTDRGVAHVQLPEATPEQTRARLRKRARAPLERAPPAHIAAAIERIVALLDGALVDLTDVTVDVDKAPAFERQVWDFARCIPCGETRTYGDIARAIGEVGDARRVGQALGRNPVPIIVPCHRVVAAGGKTGGFSAPGGVTTKLRILEIERGAATRAGMASEDPQFRLF